MRNLQDPRVHGLPELGLRDDRGLPGRGSPLLVPPVGEGSRRTSNRAHLEAISLKQGFSA